MHHFLLGGFWLKWQTSDAANIWHADRPLENFGSHSVSFFPKRFLVEVADIQYADLVNQQLDKKYCQLSFASLTDLYRINTVDHFNFVGACLNKENFSKI